MDEVREQKGIMTLSILQGAFFFKSFTSYFLETCYEAYPQETMNFISSYLGLGNMSKELVSDKSMLQPMVKLLLNKIANFTINSTSKECDSLFEQYLSFIASVAKNHYGLNDIKFLLDFLLEPEEGDSPMLLAAALQNLTNMLKDFPKEEEEKLIRALQEISLKVINKLAAADKELKKAWLAELAEIEEEGILYL